MIKAEYTKIEAEMVSETPGNIGEFPGSAIRGAIINCLVQRNCESLRYGQCDKCKVSECKLKGSFMVKQTKAENLGINPVVIGTDYIPGRGKADRFRFSITLFGEEAIGFKSDIEEIVKRGIFIGSPRVEFRASNIKEIHESIHLETLDNIYDEYKDARVKINIETPYITRNKKSLTEEPEKFIKSLTTRVTGLVIALGIDYRVPYSNVLEDISKIKIETKNTSKISIKRKSTHAHKYQLIHGEMGELIISGDLSRIYPFLMIASKLSVGKECTMGFGRFKWEEIEKHE